MSYRLWGACGLCVTLIVALALVAGCPSEESAEVTVEPPMEVEPPPGEIAPGEETAAAPTSFEWTDAPSVEQIPSGAVAGMMNGTPFTAQTVRVKRDDDDTFVLRISNKLPDPPDNPTAMIMDDDGWELTFAMEEGSVGALQWAVADDKDFDSEHVYYWYQQDDSPMSVNYPWGAALEITEWTVAEPDEGSYILGTIRGKVALVMEDDEKSWVAGEFEAVYYEW